MPRPFDHERLTVYRTSIQFYRVAAELIRLTDRRERTLGDQLHRAAVSITLNIAEGAGEFSKKEKARFYRIALRSATECAAVLDLMEIGSTVKSAQRTRGRTLLSEIAAMLTRMIRNATATPLKNS